MLRRTDLVLLLALVVGQFILLSLQVRAPERFVLYQDLAYRLAEPVAGTAGALGLRPATLLEKYAGLRRVQEENERLQRELWNLMVRVREMEGAAKENQRLLALLHLRTEVGYEAVGARVIGVFLGEHQRLLMLDAGSRQGVAPGMPVVGIEGLVGRVLQVSPGTSKVLCITDPVHGVAVRIQRTRDQSTGISVGGPSDTLRIKYVTTLADVQQGDIVETSGLDGFYPGGLPVGTVSRIKDRSDLQREVEVQPAVNFRRLEEVLVLKKAPEPRPTIDPEEAARGAR